MALSAESGGPSGAGRIVRAVLGIAAGTAVGWPFAHQTWDLLTRPASGTPVFTFSDHLKLALVFGLVVSAPIWLHQLLALRGGVRRRVDLAAVALFVAGAALAYLSLRRGWLLPSGPFALITYSDYLDQVVIRLVILGLAMQLPLLAVLSRRRRRGVPAGPAGDPRPPR